MRILENKFGYFSDGGRTYTIKDWRTPKPWINVISNGTWGVTISQTGGGYSWHTHAMFNRITRWNQDIIQDNYGKYFFLRDNDKKEVFSLTPQPLKPDFESYSCVHGPGFTEFNVKIHGVEVKTTVFVPTSLACEIWEIEIKNASKKTKNLTLLNYMELLLGAFPDWHREFTKTFITTEYSPKYNAIVANNKLWTAPVDGDSSWNKDWQYTAFFMSDTRPDHYECDKEKFIGQYNDISTAAAFKAKKLTGTTGTGFDQIAAMQFDFSLEPGESKKISFCLGAVKKEEFKKSAPVYFKKAFKETAKLKKELNDHWSEIFDKLKVKTPDPAVDILINYWLKYQTISCRLLGRTAYYQCGGAFGFRDQLQDSQIYLTLDPEKTRKQIEEHASHQKKDGTVQHWWHPIANEGHFTGITDNLLWLAFVSFNYLKETCDFDFLKTKAAFIDGGSATILDHILKAVDKALERRSRRGLSLIGDGDWNDGLNAVGPKWKGESIWLTHFLYGILNDLAAVLKKTGHPAAQIKKYETEAEKLKKAVLKHGHENFHFYCATKDNGDIIGAPGAKECELYLNSQTWAVINGIVDGDTAKKVMAAVKKRLYKDYGILLFTPAFSVADKSVGYLTRYAPAVRENGGVYTHAATWAIIAQAVAGNADDVYDTFKRICPPLLSAKDPDKYKGEPYVTPGNIEGPESLNEGQGAWTWYSGSSGWLYKVVVERLLGVRVEYGKLVIDPKLPSSWNGFQIERIVKGRRLAIDVKKASGRASGKYNVTIKEI